MRPLPDAKGRSRPTYAPTCCRIGIWVLHPVTGTWCCWNCAIYEARARPRVKSEPYSFRSETDA